MPDYLMHIQFIIRKIDETKIILNKVLEYNKESYLILGHTFDIINKIYSFINKIVFQLGIGDWGLANPQTPIPNPQSPIPISSEIKFSFFIFIICY